jgi:hypothetical protein
MLAVISALLTTAASSAAQTDAGAIVRIDDSRPCACAMRIDAVGAIGGEASDAPFPSVLRHVEQVGRDRYWVSFNSDDPISVYAADGRRWQTIGRRGAGPGEFGGEALAVRGPEREVWAFDVRNSRVNIFDIDAKFLRSMPLPPQFFPSTGKALVLDDRTLVVSSMRTTRSSVGFPVHAYRPGRDSVVSFGTLVPIFRQDAPGSSQLRQIAASRGGKVWSALRSTYSLELWNAASGRQERVLRRDVAWFPPDPVPRSIVATAPAQPAVVDIREDREGRLWVLLHVPDPRWRSAFGEEVPVPGPPQIARGRTFRPLASPDRYVDSVIEVIDGATGRLLHSHRDDRFIARWVGDSEALVLGGNPTEDFGVTLVRVTLAVNQ